MTSEEHILLTGATGYIGGRLLERLEAEGYPVRCLARRPEVLDRRVGANTEVARGDLMSPETLPRALEGIKTAYYLVHSMASGDSFQEYDRIAAENFARAARDGGISRIIYLGGLGHDRELSTHLESRQEVGRILRDSGVTTLEFRASIIIGSGSLSFEMIRALVDKLPVMITPRWVRTLSQPIAVEDVIAYLVAALDWNTSESRIFEIGGADRACYGDIMTEYARQRNLNRLMISVPMLSPRLSGLWLGLVTPVYARVGQKLVESLRNETVVRDEASLKVFAVRPRGLAEAIGRALMNEDRQFAQTRWSDALSSSGKTAGLAGVRYGSRLVDSRASRAEADPSTAFKPIRRIGGVSGWYAADWLWRFRGAVDRLLGGPGLRRGRKDPEQLSVGDTIDFWRVESYEPDRLLRLSAEMKIPGRAWLQFEVVPSVSGCVIRQTAEFEPHGLIGLFYWYSLYPLHVLIFGRMLRRIVQRAGEEQRLASREASCEEAG